MTDERREFIPCSGKQPLAKWSLSETHRTLEELANASDVAWVVPEGYIVIDVDNHDGNSANVDAMLRVISLKKPKCRIVKTDSGLHMYFKMPKKQWPNLRTTGAGYQLACGIVADTRVGGKSIVCVKRNGVMRRCLDGYNRLPEDCDELPNYLAPITKSSKISYDLVGLHEGDGRNAKLHAYSGTLKGKKDFQTSDILDACKVANEAVFAEPLPAAEFDTVCRPESLAQAATQSTVVVNGRGYEAGGDYAFADDQNISRVDPTELTEIQSDLQIILPFWEKRKDMRMAELIKALRSQLVLANLGGTIYCYNSSSGIYVDCEKDLKLMCLSSCPTCVKRDREELLDQLRLMCAVDEDDMTDKSMFEANVRNGRLNLLTGEIRPFSPSDYARTYLNVNYDPDALLDDDDAREGVDRVMDNLANHDPEILELFYEMIGCSLAKMNYHYDFFFILYGKGSNGKSVLVELIRSIVGKDSYSSAKLSQLGSRFGALAIRDKLVNIVDEWSDLDSRQENLLKDLSSKAVVEVEQKYGENVKFNSVCTFIFCTNRLPHSSSLNDDNGYSRRMVCIPMLNTFAPTDVDYDPTAVDKITTEAAKSYILNWAMVGLQKFVEQHWFSNCAAVDNLREEYVTENSSVMTWIADEELTPEMLIKNKTAVQWYLSYRNWCEETGTRGVVSRNRFYTQLRQRYNFSDKMNKTRTERFFQFVV